ncbi:MAG: CDP-alcohol phosphatidyltransferase, partial [Bacteroidales bacterium]
FNEVAMFIGVGLSPLMHLNLALLVLVFYLLLSVYVYISAHLKGEFKLTYAKMGPTELRLLVMIVNTIVIYVAPIRDYVREITLFGRHFSLTIFDFVAVFLVIVLAIMLAVSFFHDARAYAKIDPRIKHAKDSDK